MGFQSHSFYLMLGSHFKRLLGAGDISGRKRERVETNPSNQPNQPAMTGGALVSVSVPIAGTVSARETNHTLPPVRLESHVYTIETDEQKELRYRVHTPRMNS